MKNILLILPDFLGYESDIATSMKNLGYNVKSCSCSIKVSLLDRILRKFSNNFIQKKFDRYFSSLIKNCNDNSFNYVVLIFGGTYLKPCHVEIMRKSFKDAYFIYYTWDSIKFYPNIKTIYKLFDSYYSFDDVDCNNYGFKFLPLFYFEKEKKDICKYDVSTVMSFSYLKGKNLSKILDAIPSTIHTYFYLRYDHKSTYFWSKLIHKEHLKSFKYSDFKFKAISRKAANDIYNNSKAVIECQKDGQNGLSIRTFEVLSKNVKLITTNKNIKKYPFYSANNIYVYENENEKIPMSFFTEPFDTNYELSDEYSINKFIEKLLDDKDK